MYNRYEYLAGGIPDIKLFTLRVVRHPHRRWDVMAVQFVVRVHVVLEVFGVGHELDVHHHQQLMLLQDPGPDHHHLVQDLYRQVL